MQFKLALFSLGSLAVLVTATPLEPRKDVFICDAGQKLQCCSLTEPNNRHTKLLLMNAGIALDAHTGMIGENCYPATIADDKDDTCLDNNDIACCPTEQQNPDLHVGCTAMDD